MTSLSMSHIDYCSALCFGLPVRILLVYNTFKAQQPDISLILNVQPTSPLFYIIYIGFWFLLAFIINSTVKVN